MKPRSRNITFLMLTFLMLTFLWNVFSTSTLASSNASHQDELWRKIISHAEVSWLEKETKGIKYIAHQEFTKAQHFLEINIRENEEAKEAIIIFIFTHLFQYLKDFFYFKDIYSLESKKRGIRYAFDLVLAHFNMWYAFDPYKPQFKPAIADAVWKGRNAPILFDNPDSIYFTMPAHSLIHNQQHYLIKIQKQEADQDAQTVFLDMQLSSRKGNTKAMLDHEMHHPTNNEYSLVVTTNPEELDNLNLDHLPFLYADKETESLMIHQYVFDKDKRIPLNIQVKVIGSYKDDKKSKQGNAWKAAHKAIMFSQRVFYRVAKIYLKNRKYITNRFRLQSGDSMYPNSSNRYAAAFLPQVHKNNFNIIIEGQLSELKQLADCRYYALSLYDEFQRAIFHVNSNQIDFSNQQNKIIFSNTNTLTKSNKHIIHLPPTYQNVTAIFRSLACENTGNRIAIKAKRKDNFYLLDKIKPLLPDGSQLKIQQLKKSSLHPASSSVSLTHAHEL